MNFRMILAAAVMSLLAVTLYVSAANSPSGGAAQDRTSRISIPASARPDGFERRVNSDQTVSMTLIKKGGEREIMQPQPPPTCDTGCPAGQHMVCFTDHDAGMSICECQGSSGGGGGGGPDHFMDLESYSWS